MYQQLLTRTLALFTIILYLVVGSVAIRLIAPKDIEFSFEINPQIVSEIKIANTTPEMLAVPEITFTEIKEEKKKTFISVKKTERTPVTVGVVQKAVPEITVNELPFKEVIELTPVYFEENLVQNFASNYIDFTFEEKAMVAKEATVIDEVKTVQASSESADPDFFEYKKDDVKKDDVAADADFLEYEEKQKATDNKIANAEAEESPMDEVKIEDLMANDYSPKEVKAQTADQKTDTVVTNTIVATNNANPPPLFDYSKAKSDLAKKSTHSSIGKVSSARGTIGETMGNQGLPKPKGLESSQLVENEDKLIGKHFNQVGSGYPFSITVQAIGTDLKRVEDVNGFEVKFQDDESESFTDYGSGQIELNDNMSSPKMTRSMVVLKRGYVPTNTDLILEEGTRASTIPLIEDQKLKELQEKFEGGAPVGALLIELDDETEKVQIDIPFGKVINLNGNLVETNQNDYRYQLFIGVRAGNVLVAYTKNSGEVSTKISHVHEGEVTFEANYFEDVIDNKVKIFEEELLSKDSSPLIVSGERVKVFMSENGAKKINNNTYKLEFGPVQLAGRRYIELGHQFEPVFVGLRENKELVIPSENFMRHILNQVKDNNLGSRCVVQVNLVKVVEKIEYGVESALSSVMVTSQFLDSDGKFYTSASEKSKKLILVGEGSGQAEVSSDSKINIKIEYVDGTVQYLNSYCSPNTYLVEQL